MTNKKRVELNALEFDWIFSEEGADFIDTLAKTENDRLFALVVIRVSVLFMWDQQFYWRIRNYIFIPYSLYLFFFSIYCTHVYEVHVENKDPSSSKRADTFFIVVVLLFNLYFLYIEIRQIMKKKLEYFTSFLNYLDNIIIVLCLTYVGLDI